MNGKVRLSKSSISQLEKDRVCMTMDKEFLGMGSEVKIFEKEIKNYLKTKMSVVCVNTGTSALHLSLNALGLKDGDEVLVPSLTYVASFQAVSATGATPISCEVNPETFFMDVEDAKKKITEKTKVIMPVHYASNSIGMDKVYKLAKRFNLRVVEDAAQSFGSKRDREYIGVHGDIICFSFDGIKNITSGEGGAILSNDELFVQKVKDGRLLGVENDSNKRYSGRRSWDFDVSLQGFRYHMSNIMASIGIVQISRIDSFREKRQKVAKKYVQKLKGVKGIKFLDIDFSEVMPHIFVIKANNRDNLREYLTLNNIECGLHYKPNHLLSKYKQDVHLPVTEKIYREMITLPCHFDLSDKEQDYVIRKILDFYST